MQCIYSILFNSSMAILLILIGYFSYLLFNKIFIQNNFSSLSLKEKIWLISKYLIIIVFILSIFLILQSLSWQTIVYQTSNSSSPYNNVKIETFDSNNIKEIKQENFEKTLDNFGEKMAKEANRIKERNKGE